MALSRVGLAYHYDHNMLPSPQVGVPAREQPRGAEPNAPADLIRFRQGFRNPVPMLRQGVRVSLSDVALPFSGQFDVAGEVGAGEAPHRCAPLNTSPSGWRPTNKLLFGGPIAGQVLDRGRGPAG